MTISIEEYQFTILQGLRVRSGTNYLSKLMSSHPDIQLVPPKKTTDEFPFLATATKWQAAHDEFVELFNGNKNHFSFEKFAPHLGNAWLNYIVETFALQPGHVFVKDPRVFHLEHFFNLFPKAKLILLVRDGRDNVASCMKATLAVRASTPQTKIWKNKINHWIWRDFVNHTKAWVRSAQLVAEFDRTFRDTSWADRYLLVRYEDIFQQPREYSQKMFDFMGLDSSEAILDKIATLEVVGSSFYGPSKKENAHKPNWIPTERTAAFNPVGRWHQWNNLQKQLFKRLAGSTLTLFDYEKDLNW